MKISKLILELQEQYELHGDLEVIQEATLGIANDVFPSTIERLVKVDRWLDIEETKHQTNIDREASALLLTWKD